MSVRRQLHTVNLRTLMRPQKTMSVVSSVRSILDAARIRAGMGLVTSDALHAATALRSGCALFVSNDADYRRVQGLPIVILDDFISEGSQE